MASQSPHILPSAHKHGVQPEDILRAWERYVKQFIERNEPLKVIRIGFDSNARLLEIGGEIYADGSEKIFHAMAARKRYLEGLWTK